MTSIPNFRIELDDPPVHCARNTQREVTGIVVFLNYETRVCQKITVALKGSGQVTWRQRVGKRIVRFRSEENYINEELTVWNEEGVPGRTLAGGQQYAFPFRFALSDSLPSSFRGTHGHIRYVVEAKIHIPGLFSDKTTTTGIRVRGGIGAVGSTEQQSALFIPTSATIREQSLLSPAPLVLEATVPKRYFDVGEKIPFSVSLSNGGSGRVTKLRASLIQVVKYFCRRRALLRDLESQKEEVVVLDAAVSQEIGAEQWRFEWIPDYQLTVPPMVPNIARSSIISIQYAVTFEAVLSWAKNAYVSIPVTLCDGAQLIQAEPDQSSAEAHAHRSPSPLSWDGPPSAPGEYEEAPASSDQPLRSPDPGETCVLL